MPHSFRRREFALTADVLERISCIDNTHNGDGPIDWTRDEVGGILYQDAGWPGRIVHAEPAFASATPRSVVIDEEFALSLPSHLVAVGEFHTHPAHHGFVPDPSAGDLNAWCHAAAKAGRDWLGVIVVPTDVGVSMFGWLVTRRRAEGPSWCCEPATVLPESYLEFLRRAGS